MRWHVAALAALLLGWCGCCMPTTWAAPREQMSPDETYPSAASADVESPDDANLLMEPANRWNAPWTDAILAQDPVQDPLDSGVYFPFAYQIGPDHFLFGKVSHFFIHFHAN